jgi:hypothetical protein
MGKVINRFEKSLFGFGYKGIGKHEFCENGLKTVKYIIWCSMVRQVFDKKYHETHPTYANTLICDEWANFQVWGDWFDKNHIDGWQLDKDILGDKIYSPETCCFLPQEINQAFAVNTSGKTNLPPGVRKNKNKFVGQIYFNGKAQISKSLETPDCAFRWYKEQKEKHIQQLANKWKNLLPENVYTKMLEHRIIYNA